MTTAAPVAGASSGRSVCVNDFSIEVGTINGTGSQTANTTLIRAIMRMGIPVSGKNNFPSNIQGLPTWFNIRVSERGWRGRTRQAQIIVCMNLATAHEDVKKAPPGAYVVYDEPFGLKTLRDDVHYFPVPFAKIVRDCCPNARLRKLVANMIYVGVVAHLIGIELESIDAALDKAFSSKPKAAELNKGAARAGLDFATEHFALDSLYRVERRDLTGNKILIDGNTAAGLGAVMAGCTVLSWYPITPSSSLAEAVIEYLGKYRHDEDGKATYAVVQAEDELAAIGMVIGASWAGARAMTATSGPGISLMSEFIGLAYYSETPTVLANVQRVGPSTGLPTRTMQCDLLFTAYNSHGDTKHPLLLPASVEECYEMMQATFDLAERFSTPVFFVSDVDLGMNNWLADPFPYPDQPLDRGKLLDAEQLEQFGIDNFGRYRDPDGDGAPYRTLPGIEVDGASYFTRGSGHDEEGKYTESSEVYTRMVDRLSRKWRSIKAAVPSAVLEDPRDSDEPAKIGVIAFGTTHWALVEARAQLGEDHGVEFDYLRLRAFPFGQEVEEFLAKHDRVYLIEQNRDAQMFSMFKIELPHTLTNRIRSVLLYDGMPAEATAITRAILEQESN